jgi:hypothetical protein
VIISELIEKLLEIRAEYGDCSVTAVAVGMTMEFHVVDVVRGRNERSDSAHGEERPPRAVLALRLD